MLADLNCRLRALFRRTNVEQELDEELRFHLEEETAKLIRSGASPEQARRQARIALGGAEQVKEECRDARGVGLIETVLRDMRQAARALLSSPGFLIVSVLSLAIGIGANTAVFSVVNGVLLRSLPVRSPQELFVCYSASESGGKGIWRRNSNNTREPGTNLQRSDTFSLDMLDRLGKGTTGVLDVFAFFSPGRIGLSGSEGATPAHLTTVSGNYFEAGGVDVALGRPITPEDDRAGALVIVITDALWEKAWRRDPAIVGKGTRLNGTPVTVVGVTRPGFHGMASAGFDGPTDLFAPLGALDTLFPSLFNSRKPKTAPDHWWLRVMARKRPNVSLQAAEQQATAVYRAGLEASGLPGLTSMRDGRILLRSGEQGLETLSDAIREPLLILLTVSGFVLLLACLNVAVLQLAKATVRQREISVRASLGAGRGRIVAQLFKENLLLAAVGAFCGWLLALWGSRLIASLLTAQYTSVALDLSTDLRVLLFTAGAAVATAMVFGLAPALHATRVDLVSGLGRSSSSMNAQVRSLFRSGRALIAIQIALAIVLLAGSGLLLRTLWNLRHVEVGFDRERLLVFRLDPGQTGRKAADASRVHDRVLESIRSTPGVVSAASMSLPLITGWHNGTDVIAPGTENARPVNVLLNTVSPEFFATMGIRVVAGSAPESPGNGGRGLVLINETAAKRLYGAGSPVGQTLIQQGGGETKQLQIAGVVRDAKYDSIRAEVLPTMFDLWPPEGSLWTARTYAVRTLTDPVSMVPAIRRAVAFADRDLALMDVTTQRRLIDDHLHRERLFAGLLTLYGIFAVTLAAIGLYGVTAYSTARRTKEIGIRIALGARPQRLLRLLSRDMLLPLAAGVAAGLAIALLVTGAVRSILFGIDPLDIPTLAAAITLLLAIAGLATLVPAWRATRIEPMDALRTE